MDSQSNKKQTNKANYDNPQYVKLVDNPNPQGRPSLNRNTSSHDRNLSSSPSFKQALYDSDMQFFENMMKSYQDELAVSLIMRRKNIRKQDPLEEMSELFGEIKTMETKFRKALEVCAFIIDKNKELYEDNILLHQDLEKQMQRQTLVEDQNQSLFQENRQLNDQALSTKAHVSELESIINDLKIEVDQKNMFLEEYEKNMDNSRTTERYTMNNNALISAQDLQELKNQLADKSKKLKEYDQILEQQSIKYEMELKKCNMLINENRKLKETNKELNFQIDDLQEMIEEREHELDEFQLTIKQLETEIENNKFAQKQKTAFSKPNQITNPLAQIQKTLTRNKSKHEYEIKKSSPLNMEVIKKKQKSTFVIDTTKPLVKQQSRVQQTHKQQAHQPKAQNKIVKQTHVIKKTEFFQESTEPEQKQNFIRVKSQMEDFRQVRHFRKGSCPLVIVDKNSKKFQIYDRQFIREGQVKTQETKNLFELKGSKTPDQKAQDDKKVAPPPEFYPFNDLDKVIEEAQVKLRLPSSLRFQTEYVQKIGQHFQDILNRQQVMNLRVSERDEYEQDDEDVQDGNEDSEENDVIDEEMTNQDQMPHYRETFRPVSILDRGLDLNEDDFIYDQINGRGTLNVDDIGYLAGTRKNSREEINFESFNDRQGSMMIDGVMDNMDRYSPDPYSRESMYSKKGIKAKTTLNTIKNGQSMYDKRKNQNQLEIKPNQINEVEDEDDNESLSKRNRSLFKKVGLSIITDESPGLQEKSPQKELIKDTLPMDTPSFHDKAKIDNKNAFIEASSGSKQFKPRSKEEEKKFGSHQKKATDSTTIGVSNVNYQSPHAQVTQDEIAAINDSRSNAQYQSIVSGSQSIGNIYSHSHYNSQVFQTDQLGVVQSHHLRGFSSNPPPKDDESSSPSKNQVDLGSRQAAESLGGRASNSGGSGLKSPTQQSRKDPNEEFFMMTLLSYKLNHKEYEKILIV
ncbi:UNKNOWN [Stylonychia lemnae]|uniref:Uncharacterized protein n=1 Tax=Stylonychia lemnae TaxID=5949 RepID=A0A078A0B4_STYLE|nr:UNKNOWN [Stylonychia lemnae]|eukprot:CDW74223.1 UNKNOWN [Stylonychia lemnae]